MKYPQSRFFPSCQIKRPAVRGAAALALARHQPQIAATAVMDLLHGDEEQAAQEHDAQLHNGNHKLTPQQIRPIVEAYREQMKLIQAWNRSYQRMLSFARGPGIPSRRRLFPGYRSGCRLSALDRIVRIPPPRFKPFDQRTSKSPIAPNGCRRKRGLRFCPSYGRRCPQAMPSSQARIIRILGWQGDQKSLPLLRTLQQTNPENKALVAWAIEKIEALRFQPWTN